MYVDQLLQSGEEPESGQLLSAPGNSYRLNCSLVSPGERGLHKKITVRNALYVSARLITHRNGRS